MEEEGRDKQLLNALKEGGLNFGPQKSEIKKLTDENSINEILELLEKIHDEHREDKLIVNLTGGTKPMSIGAYEYSKQNKLQTIYVPEGRQHMAIDLLSESSMHLTHHISTGEFLAGYGFDLLNNGNRLSKLEEKAKQWLEISVEMAKYCHDNYIIMRNDTIVIENENLRRLIANKLGFSETGSISRRSLDGYALEFLKGKWLEVFVWGLLLPLVGRGIWDLHLGVLAGKRGQGENNDLDVSFIRNQSLCIVECKTGRYDGDRDNILYKIEAIKSGPKALKVSTFLATTAPDVIDPLTGEIKKSLKNRCELYGCEIIHGEIISKLANLYGMDDEELIKNVAREFKIKLEPQK